MGNFRDSNDGFRGDRFNRRSGGFGGRGGFSRDRNSDRPRPEMHDVVCDKCKKECQVPFKPTGDKPVLCSDCFRNSGDSRGNSRSGSSSGMSQDQFKEINTKLDKILKILEAVEIEEVEDIIEDDSDEEVKI